MTQWRCYVFEDVLGDVQYVGVTRRSPYVRLVEHQIQPWILLEYHAHRVLPGVYDSEAQALAAEDELIRKLRPRFNVKGNDANPDRVSPYTMRYVAGPMRGQPYRPDLYPQPFTWSPPEDNEPWRPNQAMRSRGALTFAGGRNQRHAAPRVPRQRQANANAITPAYGTRTLRYSPSYPAIPTGLVVFAAIVAWLGCGAWVAWLTPQSATPGYGMYTRFMVALTVLALVPAVVSEARWRWLRVVGVVVAGIVSIMITKGLGV